MLGNPKQLEILLFLDCPRFCWLMKTWNHRFPRCFGMAGTDFWAFQILLSNTDFCDGWFSNSPICSCSQNVSFALTCDAYQRKAGSIPHGRRLVSVIVLNRQNLQIMIEVYIDKVFICCYCGCLGGLEQLTVSPLVLNYFYANNMKKLYRTDCQLVTLHQPLISIKMILLLEIVLLLIGSVARNFWRRWEYGKVAGYLTSSLCLIRKSLPPPLELH